MSLYANAGFVIFLASNITQGIEFPFFATSLPSRDRAIRRNIKILLEVISICSAEFISHCDED